MTSTQVETIHASISGRTRFHVPALRRSEALKRWLESELTGSPGVERASASPITGNLLVCYHPDLDSARVAERVRELIERFHSGDAAKSAPSISPPRHVEASTEAWHPLSIGESLTMLESHPGGLTADEAAARLRRYGKNTLPGAEPTSALGTFVEQFKSLPVALLAGGAALSFLSAGAAEAALLLGAAGLNAVIGFVIERRAETTIQSLRNRVRPPAWVVRDGAIQSIPVEEVVPGDILVLKRGTLVPADGRIIEADRLRLNEAALTGESMPVSKEAEALLAAEIPVAERLNMVYRGTLVSGGHGLAVATATGKATELGRIYGLVLRSTDQTAPLERSLNQLARQWAIISISVGGLSFLAGILRGYGLLGATHGALSLAVAAIPEGFPTITATTLALGIQNLRRHRVMVHRLEAVEALGAVQTICFDKTGTITLNQITATEIYAGTRRMEAHEGRITADGAQIDPHEDEALLQLMRIGALCSDTEVRRGEREEWVFNGPPMDNALLHLAVDAGIDPLSLRAIYPVVAVRRGGPHRKYLMTIHRREGGRAGAAGLVAVKGRAAIVLARCASQMKEGQVVPLGEADRQQIVHEIDRLAKNALRVVGLSYREVADPDAIAEEDPGELIWLGAVGFTDPIRPGAKEIIDTFHQAGITTVMITGDRSDAAYSVAKTLGLAGQEAIEILDSTHLRHMEPALLSGLTERAHVFARLSPAEKQQIVLALQRRGKVVAMTGDGVNDAPALKAADIGIAMGKGGTVLAREVADLILQDDRLETMIVAVRQGRAIHDNLRKSIRYLLAATMGEVIVRFAGVALNFQIPTPFFWVNLLLPALALAMEPPEPDVMQRPPRPSGKPIVGSDDFKKIAFQGGTISLGALTACSYGISRYGLSAQAGTVAFLGLSAAQLLHALNARSERASIFQQKGPGAPTSPSRNAYLWLSIGGTLLLQSAALSIPGARSLLGLAPISLLDGAVIAGAAALPLLINEAAKEPYPTLPPSSEGVIARPAAVAAL